MTKGWQTIVTALRLLLLAACLPATALADRAAPEPRPASTDSVDAVDIGTRLELFVDDYLVDALTGEAERRMHHPVPREVVHVLDKPWEGDTSAYLSAVQDGELIRIYYNATPPRGGQVTAVIESHDGIHFTRPNLGLIEVSGSTSNNLVYRRGASGHNFTPFLDTNPDTPADARYKAVGYNGFSVYASPDGIHWRPLLDKPALTGGPFDSQNLAFWDPVRKLYVGYMRAKPPERNNVRDIRTSTSPDFITWTEPQLIDYDDDRLEHLYTSGIQPYFRAPHIYIGLPNRFNVRRKKVPHHPNTGINDVVLMSSRDGNRFQRWRASFIRPGTEWQVWTDRNNYPAWGMVQVCPEEISLYWTEHYRYPGMRIRRGTIRTDGFVSIHAGGEPGELLTRPLRFRGDRLIVNYATSAAGELQFELTDAAGEAIPGFTLEESPLLFGNAIEHLVTWKGGSDVSRLAGQPIRLRVRLRDADLYSIRFAPAAKLRARLEQLAADADTLLAATAGGVSATTRDALAAARQHLETHLAQKAPLPPRAIEAGTTLRRAIARIQDEERVAHQAGETLTQANRLPGAEDRFGALYRGAVRILEERLVRELNAPEPALDELRDLTHRLRGAIADDEDARAARHAAEEQLAATDAAMRPAEEGFGRLLQERIARRGEALRNLLRAPGTTIGALHQATDALAAAVTRWREVEAFPPLQPVEIAATPAVATLAGPDAWERGLRVGLEIDGEDLVAKHDAVLCFDGEGDYVACAAGDELKPAVVTVEAWVRIEDGHRQWFPLVLLGGDPHDERPWTEHAYNLWVDRNQLQFTLGSAENGTRVRTKRGPTLRVGEWQHVAGQFDGAAARLFINGEPVAETAYTGSVDYAVSDTFRIGGRLGKYEGFKGRIRDVRVWNTARTAQQIRENMHRQLTGNEVGLAGYWLFGIGAGTADRVHDKTSGGNPGRITGATWRPWQGYYLTGPLSFPAVRSVGDSRIEWRVSGSGEADDGFLTMRIGVSDDPEALPDEWVRARNGEAIPCVQSGQDLEGKFFWLKAEMSPPDPSQAIRLHEVTLRLEL